MRITRLLPLAGGLFAVTAPVAFSQVSFDFSSAPSPAFTTAGTTWTLDTVAGTYSTNIGAASTTSTASILQSAFGGAPASATGFTLSSTFTVNSVGAGASNSVGFGLLGNDTSFSGSAGNPYYLVDVSRSGVFRIIEINSAGNTTLATTTISGLTLTAATTYSLSVTANYVGSDLSFSASFFEGASSLATLEATDTTALTGQNFGYRLRTTSSSPGINVSFDNFDLAAIPEPSAFAALAGLGALGLAASRRRRR